MSSVPPTGHIFEPTTGTFTFEVGDIEGLEGNDTFGDMCLECVRDNIDGHPPQFRSVKLTHKQVDYLSEKKTEKADKKKKKKSFLKTDSITQDSSDLSTRKIPFHLFPSKFKVLTKKGIYLMKAELDGVPINVELSITHRKSDGVLVATWKLLTYTLEQKGDESRKVYTDTTSGPSPVFYICHRLYERQDDSSSDSSDSSSDD